MSYSALNIEVENWESFINQHGIISVFGRSDFLIKTAAVYGFDIDVKVILFNDDPVLALPLFVDNKRVVSPNHYFYQFVWQKETTKESWNQLESWCFLLKILKEKYKYITLRLPTNIKDVRPFIWNDFNINVKYTYEKDITQLIYNRNLQKILKKPNEKYFFKKNYNWQYNWNFHYKDLLKFNASESQTQIHLLYFKGLKQNGQLEIYNAYNGNDFITSIVTILDHKLKFAYFALMGSVDDEHYRNGLPTLLYNYALNQLKESDFCKIDFLGANMEKISKYKSKFLPNLETYYEVSYSKPQNERKLIFSTIKNKLKKIFL